MSDIEFKTDVYVPSSPQSGFNERPTPKILGFIMKVSGGAIKDEKTASVVVVTIFVLIIIIALFVIPRSSNSLPTEDMHTSGSKNGEAYYPGLPPSR